MALRNSPVCQPLVKHELAREPVGPIDVARDAQALERPAGGLEMRSRSLRVPPVTGEVGQFQTDTRNLELCTDGLERLERLGERRFGLVERIRRPSNPGQDPLGIADSEPYRAP